MELARFSLDEWLERHQPTARYDLAASTGPRWSYRELVSLMNDAEKERLWSGALSYCPGTGHEALRTEIAAMYGASAEEVQIVAGASEALLVLFFLAAEPGANVVISDPCFPPMASVPRALGMEVRRYRLEHEEAFAMDPGAIERLVDSRTKLVLVNSPHNPTGATMSEEPLRRLATFCESRGVQLVVDEVYHPLYYARGSRSAGEVTRATVIGDFSKAFCLSGLRTGWILERDSERRRRYWNARAHFSISNNFPGELLAEVAVRHRERLFDRASRACARHLEALDAFFSRRGDVFEWVRPAGGTTAFPRRRDGRDARGFAEAAIDRGVLLAPGDCFGRPEHFRLGFAACDEGFDEALGVLGELAS